VPIYDYTCSACGENTEVVHGINDPGPRYCPACGAEGTMKKAFAPPAILFKGSGWARKERSATATPGTKKKTEAGAGTSDGSGTPAHDD
jgi:putative FmdB family regulatory protein